ncbi:MULTISPECIES: TlyA family RNA methyltransferase [unclassified Arthrobacter]|uniref:TlyA family RNA methyltransferase n=1 Tax=unclassified Arthrobacter TaxID=235627 RepID=UPI00159D3067|nr:TlyA family RNA methyltransferase [Arthrobacter sp. STN4]MCQ9164338.1 TlyA family RNA methyltransferase [Arthrobacter sp. STN4]NVM99517.1 TlyA family RNA methyltransferase [Arthrobacter sp. SDTb3-6]
MTRLDQELVNRRLARSRTVAAALIKSGRVTVDGTAAAKAALAVTAETGIELQGGGPEYVSRAGHKLAGALACFPQVTVAGKRCFDAGASTGGFTDVLLRNGAARVAAVDVGHGQLVPALRDDPRVDVYEGMNIRYLDVAEIGGAAELTVCDLSFISLTLVMAPLALATRPGGDLLLMVKPQFEVGRERLARTGVVSSENERRRAVGLVARAALDNGLTLRGLGTSTLPGQDGNVEYFLWASRELSVPAPKIEEQGSAVEDLLAQLWP